MNAPEPVSVACVSRVDTIFTMLSVRRLRRAGVVVTVEEEDLLRALLHRAAQAGVRVRLQLVERGRP